MARTAPAVGLLLGRLPRVHAACCMPSAPRRRPHSRCPHRPCAQMYGFGLVSCVVDNANSAVRAQLGGAQGWATVSLEQLLGEHQKRAAGKPGK